MFGSAFSRQLTCIRPYNLFIKLIIIHPNPLLENMRYSFGKQAKMADRSSYVRALLSILDLSYKI
jgi:hypothetical protein